MERKRVRGFIYVFLFAALNALACAHGREVVYPGGDGLVSVRTGRGVHVRAPFVNVRVQDPDVGALPPQGD